MVRKREKMYTPQTTARRYNQEGGDDDENKEVQKTGVNIARSEQSQTVEKLEREQTMLETQMASKQAPYPLKQDQLTKPSLPHYQRTIKPGPSQQGENAGFKKDKAHLYGDHPRMLYRKSQFMCPDTLFLFKKVEN